MKGSYILVMHLDDDFLIKIGKMGDIDFRKGCYAYVGSGLNNLESRIKRHLRSEKKHHWHIDYLLDKASIDQVFYKEDTKRQECKIASILAKCFNSVPSFGCSDCKCESHLFYGKGVDFLKMIDKMQLSRFIK